MTFDESLRRIKDFLANDAYNLLGYPHTAEQLNKLEPWFYPKKEKEGLPAWVGEFLNQIKEKYPLAAQRKFKVMGSWNLYYFCGIQADGLTLEQIQAKMLEYHELLNAKREKPFKNEAHEVKGGLGGYMIMQMFVLIFANGLTDDQVEVMRAAHKKVKGLKYTYPYVIDIQGKRSFRHSGLPNVAGIANPKTFDPAVLQ